MEGTEAPLLSACASVCPSVKGVFFGETLWEELEAALGLPDRACLGAPTPASGLSRIVPASRLILDATGPPELPRTPQVFLELNPASFWRGQAVGRGGLPVERPQGCTRPSQGRSFPVVQGVALGPSRLEWARLEGVMGREPSRPSSWQHHPSHPWQ